MASLFQTGDARFIDYSMRVCRLAFLHSAGVTHGALFSGGFGHSVATPLWVGRGFEFARRDRKAAVGDVVFPDISSSPAVGLGARKLPNIRPRASGNCTPWQFPAAGLFGRIIGRAPSFCEVATSISTGYARCQSAVTSVMEFG